MIKASFPTLIGKKVSIANSHFLQFLYSDYRILENVADVVYSPKVIFLGRLSESNLRKVTLLCSEYILVTDYGDISLLSVKDHIQHFFPDQTSLISYYETYSVPEFQELIKPLLVRGASLPTVKPNDVVIYHLFESLVGGQADFHRIFFRVLDNYAVPVITASVYTFLLRVKSRDWASVSKGYRSILNRAQIKFGPDIDPTLSELSNYSGNDELFLYSVLWRLVVCSKPL